MRKRYPNHRLVKIHYSYTVDEAARLCGVHKNTVRNWVKNGLATIDNQRPWLILGSVLAAFLKDRRVKNKKRCNPGEIYCVRCRSPKFPAENMADYQPVNDKIGTLKAICPDCNSIINRRVSLSQLKHVCGNLDISFPKALRQLVDIVKPSVNCDLRKGDRS